jgi:hypothetical protein
VSDGVKFLLFVLAVIVVIGGGSWWLVSLAITKEEAHCAELNAERVSSGRYGYICVTEDGRVVWH